MALKTNKSDVIANFVRYYGRQPSSTEDLKTVEYLTTKAPSEVESLLAKNSPITKGKLWGDYQKTITPPAPVKPIVSPTSTQIPQNLNTTQLGKSGVNALFKQYYGRDASQDELNYWSTKSDAELRPKLILNSATELERNKPKPEDEQTPADKTPADNSNDFISQIIALDPYLVDYFKDATNKANFDKLAPEQQTYMLQLIGVKQRNIAAGKIINPNVTLEPAKMQEFLDQAKSQIDPYYAEQIGNFTQDLQTSIRRLQEDYTKNISRGEETFKTGLGVQAEGEAQAGLAFGSERNVRLGRTITGQNQALEDTSTQMARSMQDLGVQTERTIGSSGLAGLNLSYGAPAYIASESGYTPTGTRLLFTPQGNLIGTLPAQRSVDEINRQNQLAAAQNAKNTADYEFNYRSIFA